MIYELILNCQLQIGIVELLIDDPCFRSMPRVDYCLVGKRKEFVADGGNQYLLVSTPKVGYTETEIDEFLENIDYHALLQAVWNKAETVYAYRADGKNALSLDYRSAELFKQRATLLYEDVGDSYIGAVFAARSMELWLLEDMGFAVVAKFSVNAGEGEYITEYRVYKGSDWADSEISLDLEDLVAELAALCDPYYEHEQPIYEL